MKYAIIEDGIVQNIVLGKAPVPQNWIEATDGAEIGGTWDGSHWGPPPVNLDELAAEARAKRNGLLAASDWTQVADAPVDQAAWATYRQALRDITAQVGFPADIAWPTKP